MSEKWRQAVNYEGWYDVSDLGRIRRMKAANGATVGKILTLLANNRGYWYTQLSKNGKVRKHLIHRLVMEAFVGPCPDKIQVNHKDGDKTNIRLDNLEYMTQSENMVHGRGMGLFTPIRGEDRWNSILTEENVHEIRRLVGKETPKAIAARFGVGRGLIYNIIHGKRWAWLKEEEEEE